MTKRDKCLALFAGRDEGLTMQELIQWSGLTRRMTRKVVNWAMDSGRVMALDTHTNFKRYVLAEYAPALKAQLDAQRLAYRAEQRRKRLERCRERWDALEREAARRRLEARLSDTSGVDTWPIRQRWVPASQAKPLRIPAVNCVWNWAA